MSKLRRDIEQLVSNRKKARDYDPEDINEPSHDDSAEDSDQEEQSEGGREHYETVGKSGLRKPAPVALDAKYGGVPVSRHNLDSQDEDNDEDDPLAPDEDDSDNDDPFAENRQARKPKKKDSSEDEDMSQSGEHDQDMFDDELLDDEEDEEELESEDDQILDGEQDETSEEGSEQSEEDEDSAQPSKKDTFQSSARRDLRAFLANDTKELANSLSQAAIADAAKGRAVKKQYQTFDRILDARMKLQKGLVASDELVATEDTTFSSDAEEALQSARGAARDLFNTITAFRESIANASASSLESSTLRKRKRPAEIQSIDDLEAMWNVLDQMESETINARRTTLDKWSRREKSFDPTLALAKSKSRFQDASSQNDQLTSILDLYIANEQDKIFRSRDDRGNDEEDQEPVGGDAKPKIPRYDDSIFYQSLLRDLIASRSATSSSAANLSDAILPHNKLHPSGNVANKRNIDTKASKGRKVRYTVHEKLQGFMAAEGDTGRDTAMWTERGKDEFFGSLFGQDRVLVEDDRDVVQHVDIDEDQAEVEALRLFRR